MRKAIGWTLAWALFLISCAADRLMIASERLSARLDRISGSMLVTSLVAQKWGGGFGPWDVPPVIKGEE